MALCPTTTDERVRLCWTSDAPRAVVPPSPPTTTVPSLPVLVSTALTLELLTAACPIDLGKVTAALLRDPFATLELFRRAGEECEETFERAEDCLVSLPVAAWPGTSGRSDAEDPNWHVAGRLAAFAEHARQVAERCRSLARSGEFGDAETLDTEKAYLVGLLHEAGELAALLGEGTGGSAGSSLLPFARRGARSLPSAWCVPLFVREVIEQAETQQPWAALIEAAHRSLLEEVLLPA